MNPGLAPLIAVDAILHPQNFAASCLACASMKAVKNMRTRQSAFVLAVAMLSAAPSFSQEIPSGTVLPIMAANTLDSAKSRPGDKLAGRLMQDVALPSGEIIRAGARVEGQVVQSSNPSATPGARLVVHFDRLVSNGKQFPISVSLRALASMQDVFIAQLPTGTFDEYGTSTSDWTTVQVGGAAVYRGDGTVRSAMEVVGRATDYGAVTARLLPAPKLGCPANSIDSEREQSLWVFSPWACGTYGFEDLTIAHHGTTVPVGTIELTSPGAVRVRGGSGWLLRTVSAGPDSHNPPAK